jgi:hypothetical protein
VSSLVWSKTGGKFLGFLKEGAGPTGGLALRVAKPMVDSHGDGLTHHNGSSGVPKASDGKAMNFENPRRDRHRRGSSGDKAPGVACAEG